MSEEKEECKDYLVLMSGPEHLGGNITIKNAVVDTGNSHFLVFKRDGKKVACFMWGHAIGWRELSTGDEK